MSPSLGTPIVKSRLFHRHFEATDVFQFLKATV